MRVMFTDDAGHSGPLPPGPSRQAAKQSLSKHLTGIGTLAEADRAAVAAHFLRLSPEDRALRFAAPKNDALINTYADSMALDGSLGLFLDDEIVGVSHLPHISAEEVELGISIEPRARSSGWGHALLSASLESMHAGGNKGLTAHYVATNRPMAQLLSTVPRHTVRSGPDVCARVDLDGWAAEAHASNLLIEAEA